MKPDKSLRAESIEVIKSLDEVQVTLDEDSGERSSFAMTQDEAMKLWEYLVSVEERGALGGSVSLRGNTGNRKEHLLGLLRVGGIYLPGNNVAQFSFLSEDGSVVNLDMETPVAKRLFLCLEMLRRNEGWLPPKFRCYFVAAGKRCPRPHQAQSSFCPNHEESFSDLDNPSLIEHTAQLMRDVMTITENKKVGPKMDAALWENINNHLNALAGRGYSLEDVEEALGNVVETKGLFDDLVAEVRGEAKWKKFEKLTLGVHLLRSEGAQITYDDKIVGKRTNRQRQIDLSVRFKQGYYDYLAVVECKDYKISIDLVEAFRTKLEDVSADRGIMVSSVGFEAGAKAAAEAYGIEIFTLQGELSDWTKRVRETQHDLPMAVGITFDHDPLEDAESLSGFSLFAEIKLSFPDGQQSNLANIIRDVCLWAHKEKLPLPAKVDLRFSEGVSFRVPEKDLWIAVRGLLIRLEQVRARVRDLRQSRRLEFVNRSKRLDC
ncbi:MAG: restriction endonuclease [Thermoanaerobaculia bacterium]